jgi:four helix bundle protein
MMKESQSASTFDIPCSEFDIPIAYKRITNVEQGTPNDEGKTADMTAKPRFDLEDRLVDFAVRIINVVEALPDSKAGRHVAGQLVRAGTSPAPNYGEAQSAESRRDFIHKMKIALKELRETLVWLKIIERKPLCAPERLTGVTVECNELISIFVKSIETAENNAARESECDYQVSQVE